MTVDFIELVNGDDVIRDLDLMAARMLTVANAFATQVHRLEDRQSDAFTELAGRYVDTGAVKDSLTMSGATGAIRRIDSATEMSFGTDLFYARFLTETVGPPTPAGGLKRPLPVAVMKLDQETANKITYAVEEYIVGGLGERIA